MPPTWYQQPARVAVPHWGLRPASGATTLGMGSVRPVIAKREVHTFAAKRKRVKDYSSDSSGTERDAGGGHVENRIYRAKGESYDFYVFHKGKKITFGDSSMPNRNHNDKARANFNSRHSCSEKKDKSKAGYWACRYGSEAYVMP
jgi:hypothetical protein